jgi:malate/lactate dehydrogenase
VESTVPISLNDTETEALGASADTLKNVIEEVL